MNENKCCICHQTLEDDFGNNAEPLMSGRCCNECNTKHIIPFRLFITSLNSQVNIERDKILDLYKGESKNETN